MIRVIREIRVSSSVIRVALAVLIARILIRCRWHLACCPGDVGNWMDRRRSSHLRQLLEGRRAYLMASLCGAVMVVAILSVAACRRGGPAIGPAERPPTTDGTISGTVRGPEGTSSIAGRDVTVINVDTGERQQMQTNTSGGFTFKVKPGKYRVEVAVLQGESVLKRPGVMNVNRSDVDAHADFVIGSAKSSSRRKPNPSAILLGQPTA